MSAFDDDEALFEDIYDDDTKTETKPAAEETKETDEKVTEPETSAAAAEPQPAEQIAQSLPESDITAQTDPYNNNSALGQHVEPAQQQFMQPPQVDSQQKGQDQYNSPSYPAAPPPDKDIGKMFIGGLNWDTTEQALYDYFSKYGEILDHTIMKDQATGRSRGFGFLTFRDARSVDAVIRKDHILDGKLIDPKRAIAKEEQDKIGKIFVGGIDPLVNEKNFYDFFSQFGRIMDAQLMIDKDTGRSRGFGFITFDSPEAVDRVCVNKYLTLKGKAMEVKRAEPRGQHNSNQSYNQQNHQQQNMAQNNPYNAYGQGIHGVAADTMQEYWKRMQWYMVQQQQAEANGEAFDQPQEQPLNPQQQALTEESNYDRNKTDDYNTPSGPSGSQSPRGPARGNAPSGPSGPSGPKGPRGPRGDPTRERPADALASRLNLPKGPKGNALPSGPSGGNGNGGGSRGSRGGRRRGHRGSGASKKEEFHPYGGKGRR